MEVTATINSLIIMGNLPVSITDMISRIFSWRHNYMGMLSTLLALCVGNPPVTDSSLVKIIGKSPQL